MEIRSNVRLRSRDRTKKRERVFPDPKSMPFPVFVTLVGAKILVAETGKKIVSATGHTPDHCLVLSLLGNEKKISQIALVEKSGLDRSTLSEVLRRLVEKGLVVRPRSEEDARASDVSLTKEGQRVNQNIGHALRKLQLK